MKRKLAFFLTLIMIFTMSTTTAFAGTISNVLQANFTVTDKSAVSDADGLRAALLDPTISIINLTGGIYDGQFIISRNVTINGSTDGNPSIFKPSSMLPVTFSRTVSTGTATFRPIILIDSSAVVTINNVIVDGNNKAEFADTGIGFNNAGGSLNSVEVQNMTDTPFAGNQRGKGIEAWNDGATPSTLSITNCNVHHYQKGGIYLEGPGLTATLSDCNVAGAGATQTICQNGILMGYGAKGSITENTISGHVYGNEDQWLGGACGVLIYEPPTTGITASGNNYSNNDNNFYVEGVTPVSLTGTIGTETINPATGIQVSVADINTDKEINITAQVSGLHEFSNAQLFLDFGDQANKVTVKVGNDTITADSSGRFVIGSVNDQATQAFAATISFTAAGTYDADIYVAE